MYIEASQNLFLAAQQAAQQQQQQQQQTGTGNADFSQLRNTPHFQQLRQLVQSNPSLLQPLLQQLGQSNPELLRMINSDPQGFFQLLMEGGDEEGGAVPPGSHVIQVRDYDTVIDNGLHIIMNIGYPRGKGSY